LIVVVMWVGGGRRGSEEKERGKSRRKKKHFQLLGTEDHIIQAIWEFRIDKRLKIGEGINKKKELKA